MIIWSRKRALIVGLAIILLVNLSALAGVAYNRSGDPESLLRLSQRELQLPYNWGSRVENSGVTLRVVWRIPADETDNAVVPYWSGGGYPSWLDKAKLVTLGFDLADVDGKDGQFFSGQQSKEVFLVLELEGPAHQQVLQHAMQIAAQAEQLSTANAGNEELAQRSQSAQEQLEREQQINSRLFVIDAGLAVATLRAKYPDRTHYAIVRGRVRPQTIYRDKTQQLGGYITNLSIAEINVPVGLRQGLALSAGSNQPDPTNISGHFDAEVAFGKRLEPWIRSVSGKLASSDFKNWGSLESIPIR